MLRDTDFLSRRLMYIRELSNKKRRSSWRNVEWHWLSFLLVCLQNYYLRNATIISTEGKNSTKISKDGPLYEERKNQYTNQPKSAYGTGAMQVRENPSSKLWKSKLQDPQIRSASIPPHDLGPTPHDLGLRSGAFNAAKTESSINLF